VLAIREGLTLGWRLTAALTLLAFASLLVDAGVSLVVLSPRWLGAVLLGLATLTMAALYVETRTLLRVLASRRRRQHDEQLRREI
jgi:protein-S-isoprenylcysteine O-methyltransferase Ste14